MQLIVKFRLSPEQEPRSKANERGVRVHGKSGVGAAQMARSVARLGAVITARVGASERFEVQL